MKTVHSIATVIAAGQGKPLNILGHTATVKIARRETEGNYYVFDALNPVGPLLESQLGFTQAQIGQLDTAYNIAALLVLLDPELLPELAHFAQSGDAEVRKNFAQACGQLGNLEQTQLLVKLMGDPVWWVRYRAAQALLKLKGMDQARLEEIRAALGDRFARDMFDQARAEALLP